MSRDLNDFLTKSNVTNVTFGVADIGLGVVFSIEPDPRKAYIVFLIRR
jgi:hypothetical protein